MQILCMQYCEASYQFLPLKPKIFFSAPSSQRPLTFWRQNYFFLILAHPVYKM